MIDRGLMIVALLLGFAVGLPRSAWGDERHYVLIFGAQASATRIKDKHTWATFVRAVGEGSDPAGYGITAHTISLVPASGRVRVYALDPEPARNLDLSGSLAYARQRGANTTVWGPFLIRPDVYRKSLDVWGLMNSGAVTYRAIDTLRDSLISDCIHAVSAVDPDFGRGHYPLIRTGKSASRYIARQILQRTDPDRTRPDETWLVMALGLWGQPGIEVIPPSRLRDRLWPLGWRGD